MILIIWMYSAVIPEAIEWIGNEIQSKSYRLFARKASMDFYVLSILCQEALV